MHCPFSDAGEVVCSLSSNPIAVNLSYEERPLAHPELEEALQLIEEACTKEQISALLRRYRESDEVKISSSTKKSLVEQNLRIALEATAIPMQEAFNLIRDSEENGGQHIWLFRPKLGLAKLFDADDVAGRLWGPKWQETVSKYPSLELKPNSYVISDFRRISSKPKDWLLKIYGHATVVTATGNMDPRENGLFWREFRTVPIRSVIVIRWNSPDILEIRVQKDDASRRRVDSGLKVAWNFLRPAFLPEQFRPWALTKTLTAMVKEYPKHNDLYDFRDAKVLTAHGTMLQTYEPVSDQGSLLEDKDITEELNRKLANGDQIRGLAVTWLAEKTSLSSQLRVMVAAKNDNEVYIPSKCTPKDLDHVTDQLRRFS